MRRENQNRDAYLNTLPYTTDQGVRNKAGRITLPAMLADTTDAKRRWAEANEIEVPEGFRGLPMRFETEQQSARSASTMIRDVEKARDDYWSLLEEAKGQETEASKKVEPRFAIRSFVDEKGKTKYYVKADGSRVLHGRDPAKWAIQIENYIQNLVNDEGTIDIRSADGSVLTITGYGTRALKTTAGELSNFSDYYDAYGNLMPEARTRAEASLYIDEVAQVSKDAGDVIKTDKGAEHEDLAINGWKYRDVFFEDVDGKYYQITLSVPQGIEGKQVAYGIGNIRNRKSPINPGSSLSGAPKDGTLSAISIRDGAEKSNPQFENSKKIRESIRRTFPEREARPALERAREILGSTQERYEDGRKIPSGKEVAQLLAGGLHANRSWGLKDVVRNIDAFAGKNTEVRNRLEEMIERPFNEAGGAYARNLKARTTAFVETMKALDIRTKQDSAAVQRWGEGVRQNQYGELVEYTLADLQRECPDNWRNVQRAAEVCRGIYEGYVDELNAMLEQIYPNVIEHAETDAKKRPAGAGRVMSKSDLFDLAGCANLFESSSDFLCVFLGDAFLDSLGGVVDDFLGFLEAEAGLLADDLDDLDLLGADVLQDDVELGLLFRCFCGGGGACNCDCGRRCGNAKLLFERLHELSKLENGHRFDISNQLFLIHDEILL